MEKKYVTIPRSMDLQRKKQGKLAKTMKICFIEKKMNM